MNDKFKKIKLFFSLVSVFVVSMSYTVLAATESEPGMGEKLKNAALNTVIGLTIVFAVLVLISAIISMFSLIPKIQKFFADRKKVETVDSVEKAIEHIIVKEERVDDLEIIAVITAAICAATNKSSDSFVVRSVKKVGRKG